MDVIPTEQQVRKALEASRGSVTVTAMALGVSRQTVYRLINKYGIVLRRVVA
jgi:transcriptional regulator of acetoin/glycerol metabolism